LDSFAFNIYPTAASRACASTAMWSPIGSRRNETGKAVDLAAVENGGLVVDSSDMYFGSRNNLIMPGRAKNMGDGWETKRRRGPGHDWCLIRLGSSGIIDKIEVDTNHFKGNYPDTCSIEGVLAPGLSPQSLNSPSADWKEVLNRTKLSANKRHFFLKRTRRPRTFLPFAPAHFPDGGVSRLRVYGRLAKP